MPVTFDEWLRINYKPVSGYRIAAFFLIFLGYGTLTATTKITTGNGNWSNNGTWSPSGVPNCGDSIIIQEGHVITINSTVDKNSCATAIVLVVRGTLTFGNGDKLKLPCGSRVYVFSGGSISGSGGGGSSNILDVCGTTFWEASMGPISGPACVPSTLPGCAKVLPVEFRYFEVSPCTPDLCFAWETASERNCSHFSLEVLKQDLWQEIGRVNSLAPDGYSRVPLNYSFRYTTPQPGTGYYRLKQVDLNGGELVHHVLAADGVEHFGFSVYPNPARSFCEVRLTSPMTGVQVNVADQYGRVLLKVYSPEYSLRVSIDIESLKPGIYLVIVETEQGSQVRKLVKHGS